MSRKYWYLEWEYLGCGIAEYKKRPTNGCVALGLNGCVAHFISRK